MNYELYSIVSVAIILIFFMIRRAKNHCLRRLDQIEQHLNHLQSDVIEIKDHLSFHELISSLYNPIEKMGSNARSEAAKEMWRRRKQKKLEQQKD